MTARPSRLAPLLDPGFDGIEDSADDEPTNPPVFDPATGARYYQLQNFSDGSSAGRPTPLSPWACIRGKNGRMTRHYRRRCQAADFAGLQNRLRGLAA